MKFERTMLLVPYNREDDKAFYEGDRSMALKEFDGLAIGDFHIRKNKRDKRYIDDYLPDGYIISSIALAVLICKGIKTQKQAKATAIELYSHVKAEPLDWRVGYGMQINPAFRNECAAVLKQSGVGRC